MATKKPTVLPSFYRGDTPLLVIPVSVSGTVADITGYTAYFTLTTNSDPTTNTDAFFHTTMSTSVADTLGIGEMGYFYYQFDNSDTENIDPTVTYYWDVQINKSPTTTNNFTIASGTFKPYTDYSRGLT